MLVDTNIIIACLNAEPKAVYALSEWKQMGRALLISSLTIAETLAFPGLTEEDSAKAKAFLANFISIPFDDAIAEIAARLRRNYALAIPDAGIAATAMIRNVSLVTRDRQFQKIKEITIIEV
ncbi:MAG: type II toxin-antitoxin system VapC family toxin [bacterium]|nr:type II toxin-antitoxin system VapC family toxin [bacterium]